MKTFDCVCGGTIFFENSLCLACQREVGWCPVCQRMTALLPADEGQYRCGNESCGALLAKCHNYAVEQVCNRCFPIEQNTPPASTLCDCCRFNNTIPDLTVPGNRQMWYRLEAAKRRLFYALDLLQLPYGSQDEGVDPPLSFDFKMDIAKGTKWWWALGREERVYTGHANGTITINLREADAVEREKARVAFDEAHRTIIGHFRHEIAHYYWQMLVQNRFEEEFKAAFGDHDAQNYADAQQRYYQNGPAAGWQANYVSGYASMHPWEDFAETFATYLDMISVLDTAFHEGIVEHFDPTRDELPDLVNRYVRLGIALNEINRSMGLMDVVPEVFVPPIIAKIQFVHDLLRHAANFGVASPLPVTTQPPAIAPSPVPSPANSQQQEATAITLPGTPPAAIVARTTQRGNN